MKKVLLYITSVFLLTACGGSSDDSGPVSDPGQSGDIAAASLIFPENNSLCTEAKNLTGNPGDTNRTYTIGFIWSGKKGTTYEIVLKNEANDAVRNQSTEAIDDFVVLDVDKIIPGARYSWKIIASKSGTTTTAESTEQIFTAAGIGEISFVPSPATANNPKSNTSLPPTTSVTLDWTGKDDDNDIKEYDVYFGEDNPPSTKIETITNSTVSTKEVTVASNKLYFWRIITRDAAQNESSSAVFKFAIRQ